MDNDLILMPLEDVNNLDDVVRELGIGESFMTPADAVRKLKAEIESLRASRNEVIEMCAKVADDEFASADKAENEHRGHMKHIGRMVAAELIASSIRSLKDHSNG